MADSLVLAHHSMSAAGFEDRCRAAEAGGFTGIGLSVDAYAAARDGLGGDDALAAELRRRGLHIAEITSLRIGTMDPSALARGVAIRQHLVRTHDVPMISLIINEDEPRERQLAAFATASETLARAGARPCIEFIPATSALRDLASTLRFIDDSGASQAGVVLDTFHFFRSGGMIDDILALDPSRVAAIQISDGRVPAETADYLDDTMKRRMAPGEGDFDLTGFVGALRAVGVALPWSVEVLSSDLSRLEPVALGRRLGDAARTVLAA